MSEKLTPAATLILIQDSPQGLKTLLLKRQTKASFLPNAWVFPGGKVEQQDWQSDAWQSARQAAVRETYEESGIELDASSLIAFSRWLAPVEAPKRFDTYFFLAKCPTSEVVLQEEEVTDLLWLSPKEALEKHRKHALNIIPPTVVSLTMLENFQSADQAIEYFKNQDTPTFAPKVQSHEEQIIMLYQGDVAYDTLDLTQTGTLHRCILKDKAWHYICT